MRILFLSFYFEPDLCAGSFRAKELVRGLASRLSYNDSLHIMTTMPNRYQSFRVEAAALEKRGNVTIDRIGVPLHKSGMIDQARVFMHFATEVAKRARKIDFDLVFATSSRLMTAFLGAILAKKRGAPLYLDIRDIFTDTLSDLFTDTYRRMAIPFFQTLEKIAVRQADRINLVSPGFVDYFRTIRSDFEYRTFTNGIDELFLDSDFQRQPDRDQGVRTILYAGNLGAGQGMDRIVPEAAQKIDSRWRFLIIGDGGTRKRLERRINEMNARNVTILDPVEQSRLLEQYRQADVLFLHLNDYPAFEKVLPSKIFEYAATGKPMLAGVSGYSRQFIQNHVPNSAVFDPCDVDGLVSGLGRLDLKTERRAAFISRFQRSTIIRRMVDDILELGPQNTADPACLSQLSVIQAEWNGKK